MLEIVERFVSISGEAPIIGAPTYFYRFSHCNLECSYCDTKYKNEVNLKLSINEIISDIKNVTTKYPGLKVLFTGGEPLLGNRYAKINKIIEVLPDIDFYIETNGSIKLTKPVFKNCHFVCDIKSPSSGHESSFYLKNLKILRPKKDCIKFVISKEDLEWFASKVKSIKKNNERLPLYASAVYGNLDLKTLTGFIIENKLPVNISLQLHKIIWPTIERGV